MNLTEAARRVIEDATDIYGWSDELGFYGCKNSAFARGLFLLKRALDTEDAHRDSNSKEV